jgi:hypothetical protein
VAKEKEMTMMMKDFVPKEEKQLQIFTFGFCLYRIQTELVNACG